ncbi:hypothetical protein PFLmoz3_00801 [Pseudomonas fluorescens]|uniref:Uncharacterized protein n=1 Tax=Pseudomonas fluorescens TaxID=294 RepID=A0A109LKF2_PSEFL|nr:hypothetical protein PFLmoz3_00801 [Pseudomonas fluorescens]
MNPLNGLPIGTKGDGTKGDGFIFLEINPSPFPVDLFS